MLKRALLLLSFALATASSAFAQRADLSGIKICIDPGHGGYFDATDRHVIPDPGTNFYESESNFHKALLLKSLLEAKGATVLLTRNTNDYPNDEEPSLETRVAFANANNVNWFHSIHSNAFNGTVNYTLMLVREKRPGGPASSSGNGLGVPETQEAWDISNIIGPSIRSRMQTSNTYQYLDWTFYGGANGGYSLGVLRALLMPGELSEGEFHDYYPETRRLMNNSYRKMEAYAIRDAFLQYFGVLADSLGIIAGILSEPGTGRLINACRVRILPENIVYNGDNYNNGFYMFDGLKPGQHTLRFETPNYVSSDSVISLPVGGLVFVDKEIESLIPPFVVSTTPANNDTSYAASGQVRISFSKVMDTASVRAAFSITPKVKGNLLWSNSNSVLVFKPDSVVFPFSTVFTLRVEATAKSKGGLLFDGNGDGAAGDAFQLTFKTKPVDAWPPNIISSVPSTGAVLSSSNQIINITFDEPLKPSTVTASSFGLGEVGGGRLPVTFEYMEANGRGAVNVYPTGGLKPGTSYSLVVSGLSDLSGNVMPSTKLTFSVTPTQFQYTTIEDFSLTANSWWQPSASGSTMGIDSASFFWDSAVTLRILPSNYGSGRLTYYWNTASTDWLLREYLSGGPGRSIQWTKRGMRLQVYLFGDGSGTLFRFAVDDSVVAFPAGNAPNHEVSLWTKIDWVGWRLVDWNLENDSVGSWIGNGKLEGTLRFDSFQLQYVAGSSAPSGKIYFAQLQIAKGTPTAVEPPASSGPYSFELRQNYPNPFNPSTNFEFRIGNFSAKGGSASGGEFVTLKVFDMLGREVATLVNEMSQPGVHIVQWDGKNDRGEPVSSGIYLYQLRAGSSVATRKMVLLK